MTSSIGYPPFLQAFSRLLPFAVSLLLISLAHGATINARSVSREDIAAAISLASDGDTVLVPEGQAVWTLPLRVTKGITLQGAGAGRSIIVDNLPDDQSVIQIETVGGKAYRLSAFEFQNGSRTTVMNSGIVSLTGSSGSVRLDHCRFLRIRNRAIRTGGYVRGVIDNNEFIMDVNAHCVHMWHQSWGGGELGDTSWSEEIDWGGPNALYIEDNLFTGEGSGGLSVTDTYAGARFVFRYNQLNNANIATHGTGDGAGRNRGLRQWEIYHNTWTADPVTSKNAIHIRGGTGVVFNNTIVGYTKFLTMHYYRFYSAHGKFGELTGLNAFDNNDSRVHLYGTASAGSGENTLVMEGAGWGTDQWAGYIVYVPQSSINPRGSFASMVLSNTANTITVKPGSQAGNIEAERKIFAAGERFEIRRITLALDQVGAGTSDLLTDTSSDPTPVNLNQAIDPVYVWNNTMSGVRSPIVVGAEPAIVEGIHWFDDTPRPGYSPFTYPHPLTTGSAPPPISSSPPSAPSGLKVIQDS